MSEPKIIFEDDSILVIDKPAGWITNESMTVALQPTVQSWVHNKFDFETKANKELRDGIVHRLDKETSGLLLIAKTKHAFEDLQRQFKERLVEKAYIALAHGQTEAKGQINETVGRLPWRRDRFGVLSGGRQALTDFELIAKYSKDKEIYSLLMLHPKTGRTHQIRIHLKHIGHPIVADEFYAGRKTARHDRKWCKRLFLQAKEISFFHPLTKKQIKFETELSQELREALEMLVKIS